MQGPAEGEDDDEPRVYRQRWVQLAYLAALALLSDWVCFSVAPVYLVWKNHYDHNQSELVDIFLYTNVLFCFIEPAVVARYGLRKVVMGSSLLMSLGCLLRSGLLFSQSMPWYSLELLGTLCVGAAQPFFQCTPTLLSAVWFAPDERVLATSIAINANQIGIGVGFILGPIIASDTASLNVYFSIIACVSIALSFGVYLQFQEEPPKPPSVSAFVRTSSIPTDFPSQIMRMLRTVGFLQPLITFMASIAITNAISTEAGRQLKALGGADASETEAYVMVGGAGFQVAIMFGSVTLGKIVDSTKWYKGMVSLLMVATLCLLAAQSSVTNPILFLATLFLLGSCVGPVQPISAELAVEIAFPLDENAIVALQQVCGNLFSAMTLPVLSKAAAFPDTFYILAELICASAMLYFATLRAPLKRAEMDALANVQSQSIELGVHPSRAMDGESEATAEPAAAAGSTGLAPTADAARSLEVRSAGTPCLQDDSLS